MADELHPQGHVKRPSLSRQLKDACAGYPKAYSLAQKLIKDKSYEAACEMSNSLAVNRFGYSDHGMMHGLIVASNAMQLFRAAGKLGWQFNFSGSGKRKIEDSAVVVALGALLHDVGNSIDRKGHQDYGLIVAAPILERLLAKEYDVEQRQKVMLNILETIHTHDESVMATSTEGSIIKIADGMDCEGNRSRLPFSQNNPDLRYVNSALAIDHMHIAPGNSEPLRIWAEINDEAAYFQLENVLLKKIKSSILDGKVKIEAYRQGKLMRTIG